MSEDPFHKEFLSTLKDLKTIGRYEILRKLGQGGTGVVYLGRDPYIERYVAIKFTQATTHIFRRSFLLEAQAAGRLNHPNIISIYDAGVKGDFCYITMEYIEGPTLKKFCQESHLLPLREAVGISLNACKALGYAHKQGVIHRDIKPSNIMLDKSGNVKITDFGIAQMTEKTVSTDFLGTPNYMSPEQIKGEVVGSQSDIFSLGCVLYELVTGEKAFWGDNNFTILYKVTSMEPASILSIRHDLPEILDRIIKKALAKSTAERYQTCPELAHDLSVALRGLTGICQGEKAKNIVDYIHRLGFFRDFSECQISKLISECDVVRARRGKVIMAEGEIDDTFYIILNGRAKVRKDDKVLALIRPGECFGEMGCIGGQPRVANVFADTDCILMKINSTFLDRLPESIKFLFFKKFAVTLVHRLSDTSDKGD